MEESQQKPQEHVKSSCVQWSPRENKTLINLLLDCVVAAVCDSNGPFRKFKVERRIIATLNQTRGSSKKFKHYTNIMKILNNLYTLYHFLTSIFHFRMCPS